MDVNKKGFEIPEHLNKIDRETNFDKTEDQWILMAEESEITDLKKLIIYLRNRGMSNKMSKKIHQRLKDRYI